MQDGKQIIEQCADQLRAKQPLIVREGNAKQSKYKQHIELTKRAVKQTGR